MAVPSTPQNYWVQTGNQQVYLSWNNVTATPAVTNYIVQRSTDGVNFFTITTIVVNSYLDIEVDPTDSNIPPPTLSLICLSLKTRPNKKNENEIFAISLKVHQKFEIGRAHV